MSKKIIFGIILLISVVLTVYGYIVLPDVVAIQLDIKGNVSNTEPKILSLGISFALSVIGAVFYYFSDEKGIKFLSLSIIGIVISIITILFNI